MYFQIVKNAFVVDISRIDEVKYEFCYLLKMLKLRDSDFNGFDWLCKMSKIKSHELILYKKHQQMIITVK